MKNLKFFGLASLAAVCAVVSCGNPAAYHANEVKAREYMVANEDSGKYGQFDLEGNKFAWSVTTTAASYDCKYTISYDFKTDKGTLYAKTLKDGVEFEADFTCTYNWEYDEAADTEGVGPYTFEYTKVKKGSLDYLDTSSESLVPGVYYADTLAVSYKLQGTAFLAVQEAYALATTEAE